MFVSAHPPSQTKPCIFMHIEYLNQMAQKPEVEGKAVPPKKQQISICKEAMLSPVGAPSLFIVT